MKSMMIGSVGAAALAFSVLTVSSVKSAETFGGGDVKKGNLSVSVSENGAIDAISLDGVNLLATNGGLTTTGSPKDEWEPWCPQMWLKETKVEKEETADCTTITATGVMKPKDVEGQNNFKTVIKVYADKIVFSAKIDTPVKALWRRCGGAFWLDSANFANAKFRADGGEWKDMPETRGNRNLLYPDKAAVLDVKGGKYLATFKFDGIKTYFFDEREGEKPRLMLEYHSPQQESSDARGNKTYGVEFSVAITLGQNK
ncbi:MAG: hypothetical protein WAX69_06775 [Victivallales bacterium]